MQADMLCPFHNGGRPHYQSYSGGVVGATWHAVPLLDKAIIPVPWWCECAIRSYHPVDTRSYVG